MGKRVARGKEDTAMVRDPCCRPKLLSLASGTPPLPPPGSAVSGAPAVDSWTGGGQSPPHRGSPQQGTPGSPGCLGHVTVSHTGGLRTERTHPRRGAPGQGAHWLEQGGGKDLLSPGESVCVSPNTRGSHRGEGQSLLTPLVAPCLASWLCWLWPSVPKRGGGLLPSPPHP